MPSIEEGIASLKSLSDAKDLEDRVLSLKMLLEEGIITQDEADQRLKEFKRNRGMADGGEIKDGIATFIPHMRNGGESFDFDRLFRSLLQVESNGRHFDANGKVKVSPAGAIGIGQVMIDTAMQPGYKVKNIFTMASEENIPFKEESKSEAKRLLEDHVDLNLKFASSYFKGLLDHSKGDVVKALQGYNLGMPKLERLRATGVPLDPKKFDETIKYPIKVLAFYNGVNPNDASQMNAFMQSPNIESAMFQMGQAEGVTEPKTSVQQILEGLNLFKSDDAIRPVFQPAPQTRPTEIVEQLGLPGDMLRDAEIEREVAMNPSLVEKAKPPLTRSLPPLTRSVMMEEEEDSPIVTSSLPPLQRPFGIN